MKGMEFSEVEDKLDNPKRQVLRTFISAVEQ